MEDNNFFFKAVNGDVSEEVKRRATLVGTFEGAKRRPAFVEIYHVSGNTYTKILPKIGTGFSDTYSKTTKKPIPTLGTVTVEMDGDFGSLRRATVEFTCYDMDSFDELERTLLRPGNKIAIRYGYLNADKTTDQSQGPINLGGKKLGYEFVIYDYTFTYTKENYIKCSFKAVGTGALSTSVNFSNSVNSGNRQFKRDFENEESLSPVRTVEDVFDYHLITHLIGTGNTVDSVGFGKTKVFASSADGYGVPSIISMIKLPSDLEVADAIVDTNWYNSTYAAYCSLSYIVHHLINVELLQNNPNNLINDFKNVRYICNSNVTTGPTFKDYLFSADPLNVGITSTSDIQNTYGGKFAGILSATVDPETAFSFKTANIPSENLVLSSSKLTDFSMILISRVLLRNILKSFEKDKFSINEFLVKLFDVIADSTAGMITLGLYEPDLNVTGDEKTLYDTYTKGGKYHPILIKNLKNRPLSIPTALIFDPLKGDGITRSCEVTAKVPKDMAAEAFGRNAPGQVGGTGTDGGQISEVLDESKSKVTSNTSDQEIAEIIKNLKSVVYPENKLSGVAITEAKSLLKDIMNKYISVTERLQSEQILYPLEMKLVLDGIEGFRFGDHISTTNIPAVYRKSRGLCVGFTVLRTTHTIAANDWTTELTTIARLVNG